MSLVSIRLTIINIIFIAEVLSACNKASDIMMNNSFKNSPDQSVVDTGSKWILPEESLAKAESLAKTGDSDASYALYMHYSASAGRATNTRALYWLRQSANQGNLNARQNLVAILLGLATKSSCDEARKIFNENKGNKAFVSMFSTDIEDELNHCDS